jgi:hypothetical protein
MKEDEVIQLGLPLVITRLSFSSVTPSLLAPLLSLSVADDRRQIGDILVNQAAFTVPEPAEEVAAAASSTVDGDSAGTAAAASQSIAPLAVCTEVVPASITDVKIGIGSICPAGEYGDISNGGECTLCERGGFYADT